MTIASPAFVAAAVNVSVVAFIVVARATNGFTHVMAPDAPSLVPSESELPGAPSPVSDLGPKPIRPHAARPSTQRAPTPRW
jgi:hypothetical protein